MTTEQTAHFCAFDFAELMKLAWPRHTAKQAARCADAPLGTVKNWLQRRSEPPAGMLLRMGQRNARIRDGLVALMEQGGVNSAEIDRVARVPAGGVCVAVRGAARGATAEARHHAPAVDGSRGADGDVVARPVTGWGW